MINVYVKDLTVKEIFLCRPVYFGRAGATYGTCLLLEKPLVRLNTTKVYRK